jgi:hypothetical protein
MLTDLLMSHTDFSSIVIAVTLPSTALGYLKYALESIETVGSVLVRMGTAADGTPQV